MNEVEHGPQAPPRQIGPYRIDRLLGEGGMGRVFRARDERLGRWVAVKQRRGDRSSRARFRREARAVARLDHPAVVQVYDVLEREDGDWIVLEWVDGCTIAELLASGPVTVLQALSLARQVAEGLEEAHAKGIVHRDLKAENVMVTPAWQAKILDFGLAKPLAPLDGLSAEGLSVEGRVLGTVRTMAPEQARGLAVDARTDLFSLGVLLYEMLAGVSPFEGATAADTLSAILIHQQPPVRELTPSVPEGLSRLVDALLAKAPDLRPESARKVAETLEDLEAGYDPFDDPLAEESALEPRQTLDDGAESTTEELTVESAVAPKRLASRRLAWLGGAILLALLLGGLLPRYLETPQPAPAMAAAQDPYDGFRQGMAALERFDKGDNLERALTLFEDLARTFPDSAPARAGLARALWRRGYEFDDAASRQRALDEAERAVALDDHLAAAYTSRGLARAVLGDNEPARADLERALRLDPADRDARVGLAEQLELAGDVAAAEQVLVAGLERAPRDFWLRLALGSLLYRTGRYEKAEGAFETAAELAPDSIYPYRNLAAVLQLNGRNEEAAAALQQALRIRPDYTLYSNLGTVLFFDGRPEEAAQAYRKALDVHAEGGDALDWGNLGDAWRALPDREDEAGGAYREAAVRLRRELEATPADVTRRSRLALFLARSGDCPAAARELNALGELAPREATAWVRVAAVRRLCGDTPAAREALERARAAGYPDSALAQDPDLAPLLAEVAAEQ